MLRSRDLLFNAAALGVLALGMTAINKDVARRAGSMLSSDWISELALVPYRLGPFTDMARDTLHTFGSGSEVLVAFAGGTAVLVLWMFRS